MMLALCSATTVGAALQAFPPATTYEWRGHQCSYVKAGSGPPILLLHGFAGSAFNAWRSTLPALAETHTVYGLDLLGLGASAQPATVEYSINLWREQCDDFLRERTGGEAPIIIGHSFGSLIALEIARERAATEQPVRAVGMMNAAIGMNNKNALKVEAWRTEQLQRGRVVEPAAAGWQLALFGAVLALVDVIFNQRWLLTLALDKFATADNVRGALEGSVYVNGERVTDDLVCDYLSLAKDSEAAVEVLRQIYTNEAGPLPFDALDALPDSFPLLAVWGSDDNLAPINGPVGRFLRERAATNEATRFEELDGAGHVPQDDRPDTTNRILIDWVTSLQSR